MTKTRDVQLTKRHYEALVLLAYPRGGPGWYGFLDVARELRWGGWRLVDESRSYYKPLGITGKRERRSLLRELADAGCVPIRYLATEQPKGRSAVVWLDEGLLNLVPDDMRPPTRPGPLLIDPWATQAET